VIVALIFRFVARCVVWYVRRCWIEGCMFQLGY
jgi:hypothetical protein